MPELDQVHEPSSCGCDDASAWKARAIEAERKLAWAQERVRYFAKRLDEVIGELPNQENLSRSGAVPIASEATDG